MRLLLALALSCCRFAAAHTPAWGPAPCSNAAPCFHVVPHSHLDPGWRVTVEAYYPIAASILAAVTTQLCAVTQRTFVFGDALFLVTWLRRVGDAAAPASCRALGANTWRDAVTLLAQTGRLELAGGGWTSPDELMSPPDGALAAFAAGLDALRVELPGAPTSRVAWQIDPFGHGAPMPSLLLALNFSAAVLNRVPYRQRARARQRAALDFRWASAPDAPALLSTVLYAHYSSPRGMDVTLQTHALTRREAAQRAAAPALLAELARRAAASATGHVLLLIGDDFRFENNAGAALASLDALLEAFAAAKANASAPHTAPRLCYSTPSAFFAALAAATDGGSADAVVLERREGAFAPYADAPLSNENTWSGAYGARPAVKAAAWAAAAAGRAAAAAHALGGAGAGAAHAIQAEELAALLLHHDAVTGTCAAPVAADYLGSGLKAGAEARAALLAAARHLLGCDGNAVDGRIDDAASSEGFRIGVFNSLGWAVDAVTALPLPLPPLPGLALLLSDARTGDALSCQLDDVDSLEEAAWAAEAADEPARASRHREQRREAPHHNMLRFRIAVPPLGLVAVDARWVAQEDGVLAHACMPPRQQAVKDAALAAVSAAAAAATLRPQQQRFGGGGVIGLHASFPGVTPDAPRVDAALSLRALRYIFLPDDDIFGAGPYVTRSLLVSGLYLWLGLLGGGSAVVLALAAAAALRRVVAGAEAGKTTARACSTARRTLRHAFGGGACFGGFVVASLLQSTRLLSDAAARQLLTHGLAAGAPLGAGAALAVALSLPSRGASAATAAAFVAGGAAGVPLWLFATPAWHARAMPPALPDAAAAACLHGAVTSVCTTPIGERVSLSVTATAVPHAPLTLRIAATTDDDSEVVTRLASAHSGGEMTRDDGVCARHVGFSPLRSIPANTAAIAGFVTLPGVALLPLRPTGGVRLCGGVELSVARSATSDDGRGLGGGAPGRDDSVAQLRLALLPAAPPGALRAAHRAALHPPRAVLLPRGCGASSAAAAAPRFASPLPPGVHIAMLRAPQSDAGVGAPLRLTLHHLGEPGADASHALAALVASLGGDARVLASAHSNGSDASLLQPGGLAQLAWRPEWEASPRAAAAAAGSAADTCANSAA
jgi:hypothetical protein